MNYLAASSINYLDQSHISIGLGSSSTGNGSSFRIYAKSPSAALASPQALEISAPLGEFTRVYAQGQLRQVKTPSALVDIAVSSKYQYDLRFYTEAGKPNPTTGIFALTGQPFSTIRIENPDGAKSFNRFRVTRNSEQPTTYAFLPDSNGWELVTGFGNGLKKETVQEVVSGSHRTKTRLIRDVNEQLLSRTVEVYETLPWGEELVQSTEGLEPLLKQTRYTFYTNLSSGFNYGKLRKLENSHGYWEFYREYGARGVRKSVRQFLNHPYQETTAWPDPINRCSETTSEGDLETYQEYLQGQLISRRWRNQPQPGEYWDCTATQPAVTNWNHASNLITRTFEYQYTDANGARVGRTQKVINPDGTMTLYRYYRVQITDPFYTGGGNPPSIPVLRTLIASGQPNSDFTEVIDGQRIQLTEDLFGNLISRQEYDLSTRVLVASETVRARDSFGRPTHIEYLDGTFITRQFDCCGLERETDREGILTTYNPSKMVLLDLDHDGQLELYYGTSVSRAGVTTHTLLDPLDRAIKTVLEGSDGRLIVQEERQYDLLGEPAWSKDAMGRLTAYASTMDVKGLTLRTTTFPEGSQSREFSYPDGNSFETRGDAVQGMHFAYEVRQDRGAWVQATIQTRLEKDGSLSPEYTTAYTDFAGRAYKTEYPWPDGTGPVFALSEYNAKGQLAKATDPDGLATLYAYNGRGELETTALDLANPGVIDFGGTDRITRTTSLVENSVLHGMVVRKTSTEVWETNGVNRSTILQSTETSADGTQTWLTQYGLTTHTTIVIDRANQRRTVATENPDGTRIVTVFERGRQQSVTRLDANKQRVTQTTFTYDGFGRLQSQTDARNGPTTYTYYDDGQLHTVTTPDPDPAASGPGLDPQTTSYTYYRDPANDTKTVTILPDGGVVTQEYFPSGQLKKTWGARTYPAEYTYDRAGRMETLTTWQQFNFNSGTGIAGSATTRWNYNARGLLANKRYADNKGPGYTYTAGGKLKTRLWARGVLTTYGYDAQTGDLLTTIYSDATPAVTNTYARGGQFQSVLDASGLRTFGYRHGQTATEAYGPGLFTGLTLVRDYDNMDRQAALSVTSPTGVVYHVTYGYDPASRLNTVISSVDVATYSYHPDSDLVHTLTQAHNNAVRLTTTKLYDKLGRLQSITSVPSADSPISFAYHYNDANQRTLVTLATGEYWTYGYDLLGQVTNGVKRFPNGAPIPGYSFGYQFDAIGNRVSASREAKTDAYTNNTLNQISGIDQAPWLHVLGQVSNNATVTVNDQTPVRSNGYFYAQLPATNSWNTVSVQARAVGQATNGADALAEETGHLFLPTPPVSLQYDEDGNKTLDARASYVWDAENRLISATLQATPPISPNVMHYTYDSFNRMMRVDALRQGTLVSSKLLEWDGWNTIAELDTFHLLRQTYIWGLDASATLTQAGGVGGLLVA